MSEYECESLRDIIVGKYGEFETFQISQDPTLFSSKEFESVTDAEMFIDGLVHGEEGIRFYDLIQNGVPGREYYTLYFKRGLS